MEQLTNLEPAFKIRLENLNSLQTTTFDELFLEAVDSAFSMLGEEAKQVLYRCLENRLGISKEAIPVNVEEFAAVVEEICGQAGWLIEVRIMHALHKKVPSFRYSVGRDALSFVGYVEALRLFL